MRRYKPYFLLLGFQVICLCVTGTTVVPPSFSELVQGSDYIVRAKVTSTVSVWRDTSNGRQIFTEVELNVSEVIAGEPPTPLILQVAGGKVGKREMELVGAPKLVVGEEGFFFIKGNGQNLYPLTGLMHGLYPVRKSAGDKREFVARGNGEPLRETAAVAQPMAARQMDAAAMAVEAAKALTPSDFARAIRGARALRKQAVVP
jgi:hypothetical protein